MMLLMPKEEVRKHWEFIYPCIHLSLPEFVPQDEKLKARLYAEVMEERLGVWVYISEMESENPTLHVVATTIIQEDPLIGNRDLLVYTFFKFTHTPEEYWQDGLARLLRYAKEIGCRNITAYTKKKTIADFLSKLRGIDCYRYFALPTKED